MIITDLNFLDDLSETMSQPQGGETSVSVGSFAIVVGDGTYTNTNANSWAFSIPNVGSFGLGYTVGLGLAYSFVDSSSWSSWFKEYIPSHRT
jgi:hypothetical protein